MKTSVPQIVKKLKENLEDFEFYPSTPEILDVVRADILELIPIESYNEPNKYPNPSVLDIGCGNGSSLEYLTLGAKYGIEKSKILIDSLDREIVLVGTEFDECNLLDKEVEITFLNPPYKLFIEWMNKTILQSRSKIVFCVVPTRWKKSKLIQESLKARSADYKILETTNFLDAERSARAVVDIVRIDLAQIGEYETNDKEKGYRRRSQEQTIDPFDLWFKTQFPQNDESIYNLDDMPEGETLEDKVENQLVKGNNLIDALVNIYNIELKHIFDVYTGISEIDPVIMKEIKINTSHIKEFLNQKIKGLKHKFWHQLFENYKPITERLTSKSRERFLSKLHGKINIEFTTKNAYSICGWCLKNANHYFDDQLVSVYEDMISEANIIRYVSNNRVFKEEQQKYEYDRLNRHKAYGQVALNYRVIIEKGGLGSCHGCNGLTRSSFNLVNDLIVIAKNLGFSFVDETGAEFCQKWYSGTLQEFYATYKGERVKFMEARAYAVGTTHFRFNPQFQKALNINHGLIKGWCKDYKDVEREFNFNKSDVSVSAEEAAEIMTAGNFKIDMSSVKNLLTDTSPTLKIKLPEAVLIEEKPKQKKAELKAVKLNNQTKAESMKNTEIDQLDLLSLKDKFEQQLARTN